MTDEASIERLATGINGFDQVALGGLPAGRATLVSGTTGSGKTLFCVEFLARGVQHFGEPGVFVTFEESPEDIRRNCASLGFPIEEWEREGRWAFVDASMDFLVEAPVIGAYDFAALIARVQHATRRIGAARAVLDSFAAVFTRFPDTGVIRHEIGRIAAALEEIGVTSIVTSERASEYDGISRYGVEEFVLDNVIILRNTLAHERRRRTIEIVKFRGAPHRTGEWLFTIDPDEGLVLIPLAFLGGPQAPASRERVSLGNAELDRMCGGGCYRDAIVLLTGPSGAGKTLTSLQFTTAGVDAGERCLVVTFDENRQQMARNAAGWGLDLGALEASGQLRAVCDYPEVASLEDHFIRIRRAIEEFQPTRLVIDTLSALERIVTPRALLDFVIALGGVVRQRGITTLVTSAPAGRFTPQLTPSIAGEIASLTDVTIALRFVEEAGEIARTIHISQTRGSPHDPAVRRVDIDAEGMHIGGRVAVRPSGDTGSLPPSPGTPANPSWPTDPPLHA